MKFEISMPHRWQVEYDGEDTSFFVQSLPIRVVQMGLAVVSFESRLHAFGVTS